MKMNVMRRNDDAMETHAGNQKIKQGHLLIFQFSDLPEVSRKGADL